MVDGTNEVYSELVCGLGERDVDMGWELGTYDGAERTAEDETEETPEEEAECHGLFAADAVHEETADYAAGEVETVYYGLGGGRKEG